jgi:hypothetical protein
MPSRARSPTNSVEGSWLISGASLTVHKLRVGKARIDLRFWRDGEATRHEVLAVEGELEVGPRRGEA